MVELLGVGWRGRVLEGNEGHYKRGICPRERRERGS